VRHAALAGERAAADARRQELRRQRTALADEAARLERGEDLPPAAPPWRDDRARASRPGAPFWRLCDFRDGIDADTRRGLEAALQAAGLLDAWVSPDGTLAAGPDGEAYLVPAGPAAGRGLDCFLAPASDPGDQRAASVPAARLAALLAAIGTTPGDGPVWACADGRWGNGALHGAWSKPAAAHLGAGARAAARRERLAAIAGELAALDRQLAELALLLAGLDQATRLTDAEVDTRPDPAALRSAHRQARERRRQLDERRAELATAQAQAAERRAHAGACTQALAEAAEAAGLAAWRERLDQLSEALHALDKALLAWWAAHERATERAREQAAAAERAANDAGAQAAAETRAGEAARHANGLAAELATLDATVGAAVGELVARLTALRSRLHALDGEQAGAHGERDRQLKAVARSDQARSDAEEALAALTEARSAALARLRQVAAAGLLAGLGEHWRTPLGEGASDTAVVEAAAALARDTAEAPRGEDARDRLQSQVNERFQELHLALSARDLLPTAEHHHGFIRVQVAFGGHQRDAAALGGELAAEVAQRRQLLTARERELVENFLIDQAAEHLHDLLFSAEEWVAGVNRELAARPTSTGMVLRFRWAGAEDGPGDLAEARAVLLRPQHAWSPADRGLLAGFLQRAIAREREADAGAAWGDCLAAALDYRRWHRFAVERQQAGRWVRLTRRTHGTGSGGEKALALTLPMFAAAAAHYAAAPLAPRLILLDEPFVGIDQDMRRQCMGLLATFDLDVVMTSEREWGCYDTVPALAICQLAADPGGGCVATTRYVWNGRERRQDEA
jgi:uncharacterized protein (TIGR02680 family)